MDLAFTSAGVIFLACPVSVHRRRRGAVLAGTYIDVDGWKHFSEAIKGEETAGDTLIVTKEEEVQASEDANCNLELRAPKAQEGLALAKHCVQQDLLVCILARAS